MHLTLHAMELLVEMVTHNTSKPSTVENMSLAKTVSPTAYGNEKSVKPGYISF